MRQRAEALMIKILQYAYKMLIWSENSSVPPELRSSVTKDSQLDLYYTMLLNDEIHTYDQVCYLSIIVSSPPSLIITPSAFPSHFSPLAEVADWACISIIVCAWLC